MKKFLCASSLLVFIAFWVVPHLQLRTAPAIAVSLQDETGGGTQYLPAVDGFVSGHGSSTGSRDGKEDYDAVMNFKVVTTMKGQFVVLAHYNIERNGVSTAVDRTLPVFTQQPDKTKWAKVDDHLMACACLSRTTLRY